MTADPAANTINDSIARQIYIAVAAITGDPELLSILGSYRDTLSDDEVLSLLVDFNRTGKALHEGTTQ